MAMSYLGFDSIGESRVLSEVTNYFLVNQYKVKRAQFEAIYPFCALLVSREECLQILVNDPLKRFQVSIKNNLDPLTKEPSVSVVLTKSNVHSLQHSETAEVELLPQFIIQYGNAIDHIRTWQKNINSYLLENCPGRLIDFNEISQLFPRPKSVPRELRLIDLMSKVIDSEFELVRQDSRVFVQLSKANAQPLIDSWVDGIDEYLQSCPRCVSSINEAAKAVRRPANIPKSVKLSDILINDARNRFKLTHYRDDLFDYQIERNFSKAERQRRVAIFLEDVRKKLFRTGNRPIDINELEKTNLLPSKTSLSQIFLENPSFELRNSPVAAFVAFKNDCYEAFKKAAASVPSVQEDEDEDHDSESFDDFDESISFSSDAIASLNAMSEDPEDNSWIPVDFKGKPVASKASNSKAITTPSSNQAIRKWKREITAFLRNRHEPVDISVVGTFNHRPEGVPSSLKLRDVLGNDQRYSVRQGEDRIVTVILKENKKKKGNSSSKKALTNRTGPTKTASKPSKPQESAPGKKSQPKCDSFADTARRPDEKADSSRLSVSKDSIRSENDAKSNSLLNHLRMNDKVIAEPVSKAAPMPSKDILPSLSESDALNDILGRFDNLSTSSQALSPVWPMSSSSLNGLSPFESNAVPPSGVDAFSSFGAIHSSESLMTGFADNSRDLKPFDQLLPPPGLQKQTKDGLLKPSKAINQQFSNGDVPLSGGMAGPIGEVLRQDPSDILIKNWIPKVLAGFSQSLIDQMIDELENQGGILTVQDFLNMRDSQALNFNEFQSIVPSMKLGHFHRIVKGLQVFSLL